MKPNIAFLRKVANNEVRKAAGYTQRRGGYVRFYGGEATFKKHEAAGFVKMVGVASLGRPVYAELTEAGRTVLADADPKERGKS